MRRTKSKFGARLEPLSHVTIQLYRGKGDLDRSPRSRPSTVSSRCAQIRTGFARAQALLEAVDQAAQDREPDPELHVMLVLGLRTLDQSDSPLVVAAFS